MKLDQAFGIHEQALQLRSYRSEVLASNLANADTPGYKARDFDFHKVLQGQLAGRQSGVPLATTNAGHIASSGMRASTVDLQYRSPQQASLDGNTVEAEREQVEFGANAMGYQASLRFLDGRIKGLLTAIKGIGQ